MAEKKVLARQLTQIVKEKGKELTEAEAQARINDRFYAEVFGWGDEISEGEMNKLREIADALFGSR
jgi:hypothetical protein